MSEVPTSDSRPLLSAPPSENAVKLDVGTEPSKVKLDALGPMVVNSDGTLSRIANWSQLTELERARTLRVLSARNKIRIADQEQALSSTSEPATPKAQ